MAEENPMKEIRNKLQAREENQRKKNTTEYNH